MRHRFRWIASLVCFWLVNPSRCMLDLTPHGQRTTAKLTRAR
jgi:hypothetical protein